MKNFKLFLILLLLICNAMLYAQDQPQTSFSDLILTAEENARVVLDSRQLAAAQELPHTIYLPEGIFIQAMGIENNKVVYAIITDLANPFNDGKVAFWSSIKTKYDLSDARIHYTNKPTINPMLGFPEPASNPTLAVDYLLIPESSNDRVMSFNATTGDLINMDYVLPQDTLFTPKQARLSPRATITISDQVEDLVFDYDTLGALIGIFAPAGGVNNAILDNIRGHNFRPNGNLVVTVGGGANDDAVAEFDNTGTYVGNFIANNAGGLDSPFDIIFRASDCLVTAITSDAVHRYDLTGTYLDDLITGLSFPQQITELSNGNLALAEFSGTSSGIQIYDANGTFLNLLSGVTGNRGVYLLGNGNFLTTNGSGVHEIDGTTGTLIRTVVAGVSAQYISPFDLSIVPVELGAFTANVINNSIELNWRTITETNNAGFEIERSRDKNNFDKIAFIPGFGTTSEPKNYNYTDNSVNIGTYYYRLKQIDLDGSFTFSDVVEVEMGLPEKFSLKQNYPNPFNPSTTIEFSLPADAIINISIYNPVGEKVAEVINKDYTAGYHKVTFDASGLTSGIYFYKISATGKDGRNFTEVKKMTLVK